MVMLSFPRIVDDTPVAYLMRPSWCTAEGAVTVDSGGDGSGMIWLLVVAETMEAVKELCHTNFTLLVFCSLGAMASSSDGQSFPPPVSSQVGLCVCDASSLSTHFLFLFAFLPVCLHT